MPPLGPPYMPQRRNAIWLPSRSKVIVLTAAVGEHEVDLAALQQVGVGLEAHAVHALGQRGAALAGVAEVVEDVVAPDAEVLELDPLAAVRVLHPHVAPGPADAVAGAPVVVARAEVRGGREVEALARRASTQPSWRPKPS